MRLIFDVVKRCMINAKAFVHILALTKYPITLSIIDFISHVIKKSTYLHQIIFNLRPFPAL